jgi:hypothetical protein
MAETSDPVRLKKFTENAENAFLIRRVIAPVFSGERARKTAVK